MTIEDHFDKDTWANLPTFFDELPEPVEIHIWGDPENFPIEREAVRLIETLSNRFEGIQYKLFPRRENYPYYPVIGVMGIEEDQPIDYGVRLIRLAFRLSDDLLCGGHPMCFISRHDLRAVNQNQTS